MPSTFGLYADRLLQDLMHMVIQCRCLRVNFISDQYPVQSIRNCERERRDIGGTQVIYITRPGQEISGKWEKQRFFKCWTRCDPRVLGYILLVVSHGEVCNSIVVNDAVVAVTEVQDLFSEHEEVDTWFLLHTHQAAQVFSSAPIKSSDTDVMVLSLAKYYDFYRCLLLFMTGFGSNNIIINITELGIKLGQ